MRDAPRFKDALEIFARHDARVIVVGGVSAVLNGAPISTLDLDVVHARSDENVIAMLAALDDLDARHRDLSGRILRPTRDALGGPGHHLLITRCGPIDVLGQVGIASTYETLFPETSVFALGDRIEVRVLDLPALIRIKEEVGRDKDRAVLPILRRTLVERGG